MARRKHLGQRRFFLGGTLSGWFRGRSSFGTHRFGHRDGARLVGEVRLTQRFQGVARILEVKFQALYAVFIFRLDNLELFETFEEFVETCVLVLNLAHFLSKFLIFSLNSGNACLQHRLLCRQSLHDQACLFKATVAPRQLDGCAFALLAEAAFGIFGAPLRTAGVVDVLLTFVERIAKTSRSMSLGVLILHAVFFTITGAYYVSYPVVGGMVKDLYPEYHLDRKNLMRTMLDTGTGLAPMVSWSTTGSYTATTLGVSNLAFAPFAPMLWLSIVFSVIYAVTGIGTAKAKED